MISLVDVTKANLPLFQRQILEIENLSFPSPWTLNSFIQEINRLISHFWALTIDKELAGYICFWIVSGEIHLMNIAVHPGKRGNGFGHYMLRKMIKVGKSKAVQTAWLEVRPSNLIAIALYQKMGFRETGRRPRYYADTKEDAVVMSLPLFDKEVNCQELDEQPGRLQHIL